MTASKRACLAALLIIPAVVGGAACGGGGDSGGGGGVATDGMKTPTVPFGAHPLTYAAGTIRPSGTQTALDDAVRAKYKAWKDRYLIKGCGGYYVCANEVVGSCVNDGAALVKLGGVGADKMALDVQMTVSEGHGYGMLIAALMAGEEPDARDIFDGFVAVRSKFTSPYDTHLMSWHFDAGCVPPDITDNDAATDGDLDSAFALLLAEKQWSSKSYGRQGRDVATAVLNREMNPSTHLPLLGDWSTPSDEQNTYFATRLSDDMPDHFRAFATATATDDWNKSVTAVYDLLNTIQTMFAPMTGLVSDFVKNTDSNPSPVNVTEADMMLMEQLTTDYDYNACRVPWRIGTDYVVNGNPMAKTVLDRLNAFIKMKTGGDPSMIVDGYSLAGEAHKDAGPNGCFTGGFGVAAMSDASNQAWLDAVWNQMVNDPPDDYFGDTIRLITMIVMSGNWWTP